MGAIYVLESEIGKEEHCLVVEELGKVLEKVLIDLVDYSRG